MRGLDKGDKKLGSVGVLPGVGHGEEIRLVVPLHKVLIRELLTVDGLPASAVSTGEVATLSHETRNHTVELGASIAKSFLAGAKSTKVLRSPGGDIVIKVKINTTPIFRGIARSLVFNIEVNLDNHGFVCGVKETGTF